MLVQDLFVGAVSIVVGVFSLSAAVLNWEWSYQLAKARWIESRYGRTRARLAYGVLGILLISLGAAIAVGFGLYAPHDRARLERPPCRTPTGAINEPASPGQSLAYGGVC